MSPAIRSEPIACEHIEMPSEVSARVRQGAEGCEECLRIGGEWFHLRVCLTCGHIGCCDRSPNQHATTHFQATGHPVISSFEPGETWRWCYIDEVASGLDGA